MSFGSLCFSVQVKLTTKNGYLCKSTKATYLGGEFAVDPSQPLLAQYINFQS